MDIFKILHLLSVLILISYPLLCTIKFALEDSLSFYWYEWKQYGIKKNKPYLEDYFMVWIALVATFITPVLFEVAGDHWVRNLILPMCVGLISVGAAPDYKVKKFSIWHFLGAGTAAICAVIFTCALGKGGWILTLICAIIAFALICHFGKKHAVLFLEYAAFSIIGLVPFLHIY